MNQNNDEIFSKIVKAGKRKYFFDVKETKQGDYYLIITESKRKPNEEGFVFEKHKIFLYKEDFNKFSSALGEVINHIKTELLPNVDFEKFDRDKDEESHEDTEQ